MLISLHFPGHHSGENKDLWRASNWLFPQTRSDIEYFIPQLISKDESHGPTTHKSFRKCNSILYTGKEKQKLFSKTKILITQTFNGLLSSPPPEFFKSETSHRSVKQIGHFLLTSFPVSTQIPIFASDVSIIIAFFNSTLVFFFVLFSYNFLISAYTTHLLLYAIYFFHQRPQHNNHRFFFLYISSVIIPISLPSLFLTLALSLQIVFLAFWCASQLFLDSQT